MKRWKDADHSEVTNETIDNFLEEIIATCKKYNLSISHEDIGGAFTIEKYSNENILWLLDAHDCTHR